MEDLLRIFSLKAGVDHLNCLTAVLRTNVIVTKESKKSKDVNLCVIARRSALLTLSLK